MSDIKIESPEEYTDAQQKIKKYGVPVVVGIFVVIAAIVTWLVAAFYPQNYDGDIIEQQQTTQQ